MWLPALFWANLNRPSLSSALHPSGLSHVQVNICTTALCWIETELHSGILFFLQANLSRSERFELSSKPSQLPTAYSKPKFSRSTFLPPPKKRQLGALMAPVILKPVHPTLQTGWMVIKGSKAVISKLYFSLAKHIIQANSWISCLV